MTIGCQIFWQLPTIHGDTHSSYWVHRLISKDFRSGCWVYLSTIVRFNLLPIFITRFTKTNRMALLSVFELIWSLLRVYRELCREVKIRKHEEGYKEILCITDWWKIFQHRTGLWLSVIEISLKSPSLNLFVLGGVQGHSRSLDI